MIENVIIEPMTEPLLLWRCLHYGPLSRDSMTRWPPDSEIPWEQYQQRNVPLLARLTRTYGACGIVARDNDRIVGVLRFYPKAVCRMEGAGYLCLQQDPPAGPVQDFAGADFPTLSQIEDKTLVVHCLMAGSPLQPENPYQRKGLGSRMARALIEWAEANGWRHIEADAFEDLPVVYEITGSTGYTFWEKLGFHVADRHPHPLLQEPSEFLVTLEEQAKDHGIRPDRARDQILMRLDLP